MVEARGPREISLSGSADAKRRSWGRQWTGEDGVPCEERMSRVHGIACHVGDSGWMSEGRTCRLEDLIRRTVDDVLYGCKLIGCNGPCA